MVKSNEFSLAWCQHGEKLHILHAFGLWLHGNISKTLIILSGEFRSHVLHLLTHINHKCGTLILMSITFVTILLSSVGLNKFYSGFQPYKQFNNTALKLSICRNASKTAVSVSGFETSIFRGEIVTLRDHFSSLFLLFSLFLVSKNFK